MVNTDRHALLFGLRWSRTGGSQEGRSNTNEVDEQSSKREFLKQGEILSGSTFGKSGLTEADPRLT